MAHAIDRKAYDAVLLDLDGVITDTASLHASCWKQMFDEYLRKRTGESGEAFRPFDPMADYLLYVDGKPRADGVRDWDCGHEQADRLGTVALAEPVGEVDDHTRVKAGLG